MILLTGGTGLIGSHLLLEFLNRELRVRVLYRNEEKRKRTINFLTEQGIDLKKTEQIAWVKGDILDIPTLNEAIAGTDKVFHCAALISFDPGDYRKLRKVNIEGTANVVNACIGQGVKQLFYMSSVAALGGTMNGKPISEANEWNPSQDNNVYAITKYGAEMEVWRGTQEGVPCVIFNPGVVLGEGIWENSTEKFFSAVDKGLRYYPGGTSGFVDVKDVVQAIMTASTTNITNERFVLVGENLSYKDLFSGIAAVTGNKAPDKKLSPWILEVLWRLDRFRSAIFGGPAKLTRANARSASETTLYDNSKAKEVLDLSFTPISHTLERIAKHR